MTETTGPNLCGNGMCDAGENPTCPEDCQTCGDGVVLEPEECDDGNDIEDDACTNSCTKSACGDAIAQSGESCDEGSDNHEGPWTPAPSCNTDCKETDYCGDGTIAMGNHCTGWTSKANDLANPVTQGVSNSTAMDWTQFNTNTCLAQNHLYCFENP